MPSNNVFQYSKIRTRKRSAKKSIKTGKKMESSSFWNPESTGIQYPESGIHSMESRIQDCPGFPYMGRVSRFHFTTGKQYTREIRTEINSFRLCQNSNNFPRLKALGIKKNIAKRKRNYFPISLVTISSWSHIQFFFIKYSFYWDLLISKKTVCCFTSLYKT